MVKSYRKSNFHSVSKTSKTPRRPFEKERLDQELKLIGQYGLKNKRQVWRVQLTLAKIRKAARQLLTLDQTDERRIFQGNALIRRMVRLGLLADSERKLDFVLGLTLQKFLERRLQTKVFKKNMAKSIHHARVLIRQRHIRVGRQIVNVPSFLVRLESERHIELDPNSSLSGGKQGRVKRRNRQKEANREEDEDDDQVK